MYDSDGGIVTHPDNLKEYTPGENRGTTRQILHGLKAVQDDPEVGGAVPNVVAGAASGQLSRSSKIGNPGFIRWTFRPKFAAFRRLPAFISTRTPRAKSSMSAKPTICAAGFLPTSAKAAGRMPRPIPWCGRRWTLTTSSW